MQGVWWRRGFEIKTPKPVIYSPEKCDRTLPVEDQCWSVAGLFISCLFVLLCV